MGNVPDANTACGPRCVSVNRKMYGLLFPAPDLGILRQMADDVRRRRFIWEIQAKTGNMMAGRPRGLWAASREHLPC